MSTRTPEPAPGELVFFFWWTGGCINPPPETAHRLARRLTRAARFSFSAFAHRALRFELHREDLALLLAAHRAGRHFTFLDFYPEHLPPAPDGEERRYARWTRNVQAMHCREKVPLPTERIPAFAMGIPIIETTQTYQGRVYYVWGPA